MERILLNFIENVQDENSTGASDNFIESLKVEKNNNTNIACSICLEDFNKEDECIKLPCKSGDHYFHKGNDNCPGIIDWLKKSNTCPICREEFPKENNSNIIRINPINLIEMINASNQLFIQREEERQLNEAIQNSLEDQ